MSISHECEVAAKGRTCRWTSNETVLSPLPEGRPSISPARYGSTSFSRLPDRHARAAPGVVSPDLPHSRARAARIRGGRGPGAGVPIRAVWKIGTGVKGAQRNENATTYHLFNNSLSARLR